MRKTVKNLLISAPISDQLPIYVFSYHNSVNLVACDRYDDLSEFMTEANDDQKNAECDWIEEKTNLYGQKCIFVFANRMD